MTLDPGYHDVPPGHIVSVVTHLEMTAPAPLRGTALPDGLCFAPLARDLTVYRDLFERIGAPWLWFSRMANSDAELSAILSDADLALFTLLQAGKPQALLELDFRAPNTCELAFFGLAPTLIGVGAGAFLMDRAIELAWSRSISRFHVHTCTLDGPAALDFYRRSGFTPIRRQIEIAPDPRRAGILSADAAPQIPQL